MSLDRKRRATSSPQQESQLSRQASKQKVTMGENAENSVDFAGEFAKMRDLLHSVKTDQQSLKLSLEEKMHTLSGDIVKTIDERMKGIKDEMMYEFDSFRLRIQTVEERLYELENMQQEQFPVDTTIVVINLQYRIGEDIDQVCRVLITEGLGLDIIPKKCMRLKSNNDKTGLVKIGFQNLQEKITVLREKQRLTQSPRFKRVYIRSSQSHEQRLANFNFKTLLDVLPNGSQLRITSNGRIVKKDDSQQEHQQRNDPRGDGNHGHYRQQQNRVNHQQDNRYGNRQHHHQQQQNKQQALTATTTAGSETAEMALTAGMAATVGMTPAADRAAMANGSATAGMAATVNGTSRATEPLQQQMETTPVPPARNRQRSSTDGNAALDNFVG